LAYCKKSQKAKIAIKRSDLSGKKITIGVKRLDDFYSLVKILNKEIGHGYWTTHGRPVRKLRRVDAFNRHCSKLMHNDLRKLDIIFYVPENAEFIQSRLVLQIL
jgi:hypothetical protein